MAGRRYLLQLHRALGPQQLCNLWVVSSLRQLLLQAGGEPGGEHDQAGHLRQPELEEVQSLVCAALCSLVLVALLLHSDRRHHVNRGLESRSHPRDADLLQGVAKYLL